MTEEQIVASHHKTFEDIRRVDEDGQEFWLARELAPILGYSQFRNFISVINRAVNAVENTGHNRLDHFAHFRKMVKIGSEAEREVADIKLTRYACYLIVQNGDPSKPVIANGQTYFAIQTRRQELREHSSPSLGDEDALRLKLRSDIKHHNKELFSAAKGAGVTGPFDYALFQDEGYKGLYGGLGQKELHARKELTKSQKILDHMGSTELAANLFRATQTSEILQEGNIHGKAAATQTHREVGRKVRKAIKDIGGTMPENLPTPEKSIKQLETANKKLSKK